MNTSPSFVTRSIVAPQTLRSPAPSLPLCMTAILLLFGANTHSQAAVIFDQSGTHTLNGTVLNSDYFGQSFLVGGTTMGLTSVDLYMDNAANAVGNFAVALYSNNGSNLPGTLMEVLTGSSNPATAGAYTYTGSSALLANTGYWIVAEVTGGAGSYSWRAEGNNTPETGTTVFHDVAISHNQGTSWSNNNGSSNVSLQMTVNADAAPEPSRALLLGLGLGMTCLRRKRKQ
ncbi:MAG: hypothetical protein JWR15_931 [Prosthecobacter sp.]|nr:hypothetical protein [Prosthecobacter sp.]